MTDTATAQGARDAVCRLLTGRSAADAGQRPVSVTVANAAPTLVREACVTPGSVLATIAPIERDQPAAARRRFIRRLARRARDMQTARARREACR